MLPHSKPNTPNPHNTPSVAHNITEDSIDDLMGTPVAASTPKKPQRPTALKKMPAHGVLAKSAQKSGSSRLKRVHWREASASAAATEPETPDPEKAPSKRKLDSNAPEPAAKKKKLDGPPVVAETMKRKPRADADGAPARKRPRRPGLRVAVIEG